MLAYLRICAENHLYKDMNCLLIKKKKEYFSKYGKKCAELLYVRDRCNLFSF